MSTANTEATDESIAAGGIAPHRISVKMNAGGRGTVELDGKPLRNCRGISMLAAMGDLTTVTLQLVATKVEWEADDVREILIETTNATSSERTFDGYL